MFRLELGASNLLSPGLLLHLARSLRDRTCIVLLDARDLLCFELGLMSHLRTRCLLRLTRGLFGSLVLLLTQTRRLFGLQLGLASGLRPRLILRHPFSLHCGLGPLRLNPGTLQSL